MTKYFVIAFFSIVVTSLAFSQVKTFDSEKDGTWVIYRLSHPLHKMEATSKEMMFRVKMDPAKKEIQSVIAQVDVTSFDSGNSNRDSHAMEVIDAIDYPDATFSSTGMSQHGDSLEITGNLNFHGIGKSITVPILTTWSATELKVQGGFPISMTDFKIDRPSLLMIPVSDTIQFSLEAVFKIQ